MSNLAQILHALGNLTEARAIHERVLTARRALLGDEHPDTLKASNNLARTLYAQGDLAGACMLQERGLTESRRELGDEHPNTLRAAHCIPKAIWSAPGRFSKKYWQ
jgi:hypothetical protein